MRTIRAYFVLLKISNTEQTDDAEEKEQSNEVKTLKK